MGAGRRPAPVKLEVAALIPVVILDIIFKRIYRRKNYEYTGIDESN